MPDVSRITPRIDWRTHKEFIIHEKITASITVYSRYVEIRLEITLLLFPRGGHPRPLSLMGNCVAI